MQPIRQVYEDSPDMIPIPLELRHKRLELIIWPLDDLETVHQADRVSSPPLEFKTMRVEQVIMPSREERYER
ncbi:MAG: hypothetical protein CVU66_02255 [Deltaproteobacteria bacterium HGW-Deltaproteobacteria-23]|jgi:hypothetical protein|nr:MAG: hypothetical protein CVU66_02255 [Deltaproteobacteria bacterium HGW-Deltaproteobacteria-23]